ncbi:serine/arginine repetitive matrix protein 2 [Mastacembelus armatus]|uniref:serine/arginine repetitive matrix protein 2 n=1 Tax=Mastacembelus armatus TaxID=205130 RepID=UPI000E45716D|nr:serine/arginine repetitive matrix protein 2-like [Mastacembelus armatus]XP_026186026.1 serine/arginine repetitive matrix protein 2-like [Mastacembelus armatus]XP_026186027.1 serine/arginine repetitive matrix protein 2-like [Mastacembelus armatus]
MDSWTLQGDSYSFLRSAPRSFSLCHRDGTPNHVEIFDIINVPAQRSAISETTCLCDIFGDDCESPSVSSSPAAGACVPLQRELDGATAASPLADDLNDSSGSYHTAQGSSEGEEGFEDSRERLYSPLLQSETSERRQSEIQEVSSGHPDISENSGPNLETNSKSPVPQLNKASPTSEVLSTGERTPSPGHNSSYTLSSQGRESSLSSSSFEKRHSPSSPNLRVYSEAEQSRITPTFKDGYNSPSHQSSDQSPIPSSEPRNCISSSYSGSVISESSPRFMVAQVSPEPRSNYFYQHSSPSPEPRSKDFSLAVTEPATEVRAILSSPVPSSSSAEISSQSRETSVSPDLKNRPYSPDSPISSPFPEERERVSLPDLFSRGSTPDIEDSSCTPELISDPSTAGRDIIASENQNTRLSPEPVSIVDIPVPRYTPPSPVASPELVESSVSPTLRQKAPSSGQPSATSSVKTESRTPSPDPSSKIRNISTPSEIRTQVSSPVVSYSLSPSPEVRSNCSSTEQRHTAPSPEIRITASSPEVRRKEKSSEVEKTSSSPLLESHCDSTSSRSLTSSPRITGISYTVVEPEDRNSPPFPELSRLSTLGPDRTLVSPVAKSPTTSRHSTQSSTAESTGTPRDSPHILGFSSCVLQSEITQLNHPRYQTPSPQPKHHTPSPEPRHPTPSSDKQPSPSPQNRIRDLSPVAQSTEQRCYQHSPAALSTESNPFIRHTPEVERDFSPVDITEIQYPTHLAKDNVSPLSQLHNKDKSVVAEIKSGLPVEAVQLPVSISPLLAEVKVDSSPKQQNTEREANVQHYSNSPSLSEEEQDIGPAFSQKEDTYANSPVEISSASPSILVSKDKNPHISPVNRPTFGSPVQRLENPEPQFTTYSLTSDSRDLLKSVCIPEQLRKELLSKERLENTERFTDMAHHVNRRRTPSPPLTRFTPVHIIAPDKPYRHWQNRTHSPSQLLSSSPSGNLKKAVTNRESPNVAPVDSNSQAHWVRLGKQLEMEREMQLEEEREAGRDRQRDRKMERGCKREEQVPEKGEEWQGDSSYRGQQVELSFNARNRKGPVSCNAALTNRETSQGLPAVHSYSESLLATRQLHQQQRLLRLASQKDTRGGGTSRRLQPPAPQNKNSSSRRVTTSRPCQSSSSSMGSELDEADNEVKWFTDLAFSSLSSPEVDYLDMYNSSHRSSTNISQPSTQESPAGVNAAWLAYADFKGSAPKLDNDEGTFQHPSAYYSDGLDPLRRYEMGSFECIDVAVEKEDIRKVRRGVPKRQIQLKRKNHAEGQVDGSNENKSPEVPVENLSPVSLSSETFVKQCSTPEAMQECYPSEHSPESIEQSERKSKLQKSASLDETCSKTKMASCLIKSVLSKKMQSGDKQSVEQAGEEMSSSFEENSPMPENAVAPQKESPKFDAHDLSSGLQSDYSLSSEGLSVREEPSTKHKSLGLRSSNRPSSSSSGRSVNFLQTESEEADSQNKNSTSLISEIRSEMKVPFDNKRSRIGVQQPDDSKTWAERGGGDSANATAGITGTPSPTRTKAQMTNRDQECLNKENTKQPQQGEITIKALEKKKTSLNVCLTPETSSPDMSVGEKQESAELSVDEKAEEEKGNGNAKVKAPFPKVRDVRRLVKNTYNLSFKATSSLLSSDGNEERMENVNEERSTEIKEERHDDIIGVEERDIRQDMRREEEEFRVERKEKQNEEVKSLSLPSKGKPLSCTQPMQIEYKAICWKEDKNKISCNKKDSDDKPQASLKLSTELKMEPQKSSNAKNHTTGDTAVAQPCQHDLNMAETTQETMTEMHKVPENEMRPVMVRTERKPQMLGSLPRLPSKEREVSTAVVLIRDGFNKTKSPAHEEITTPTQAPAASFSPGPITPGSTPASSGHSVSMLLKEKGYQADIGAVVGDGQNAAGGRGVPHKHVNCLEIPLQVPMPSTGGQSQIESHRERTLSSSSNTSGRSVVSDNTDTFTKTSEIEGISMTPTVKDTAKQISVSPLRNIQEHTPPLNKQKEIGDFESVKRLDPTFPPRSPAIRRFRPQPIEVKSLSKETQKQEMPTNSTGNNKPQSIAVKSIAKNSEKPAVPPKPNCKFRPADLGTLHNEAQRPSTATSAIKPQGEERPQTIIVSSPTIYRKISNDTTSTSNYTRKLAVSAVSSLKPPPSRTTATTTSSISNQSMAPSEADASNDRGQQQQPAASLQSISGTQQAATSATGTGATSTSGSVSEPKANEVPGPVSATVNQPSQPAVMDPNNQPSTPCGQAVPVTAHNIIQPTAVSTAHVPRLTHQSCCRSLSSECSQRTNDLHSCVEDDPPSYDERESFSPLVLPDLPPRRSNRYQPSSHPPPCSCTAGCHSHPGLTPPHSHRSPHNLTSPAPSHSPGQGLSLPVVQAPLRPHQCRPDPQLMNYQPGSPKSTPLVPGQPPALYQPLHQPLPCPPHPSFMHPCPAERPLQPLQHIDPRRPPVHKSPQQQPPGMAGAPYNGPGHTHSPGLPPIDPQYLCGPQTLGPSYGSEYGGDSSSLYSESSYGQTPRRVLLDPETGKYFYIEVPVQPLRKMLFDPETGQYVEVLIPQQAMSHSGLYPPSAAPYPPLHNPNMYAPAPQYMPYAAPPPAAHPQAHPQPPRYPEASGAAAMHPSGPGVSYRNPSAQGSKPEPQNHPPLDQSYLESMYYVPTGMNASPNPTPPDYYHKHPPNLPPAGGKRS